MYAATQAERKSHVCCLRDYPWQRRDGYGHGEGSIARGSGTTCTFFLGNSVNCALYVRTLRHDHNTRPYLSRRPSPVRGLSQLYTEHCLSTKTSVGVGVGLGREICYCFWCLDEKICASGQPRDVVQSLTTPGVRVRVRC